MLKGGPFVRKQSLFPFITCLLLGAVIGCEKHAKTVVFSAEPDVVLGVYVQEGDILTFTNESTTFPNFTVDFDTPSPCKESHLTGSKDNPAMCQIRKGATGAKSYKFTITETGPPTSPPVTVTQSRTPPRRAKTGYVRPCKNCS